jgi:hypothetical protein
LKSNFVTADCGEAFWLVPEAPMGVVNDCATCGVLGAAAAFLPPGVSGC